MFGREQTTQERLQETLVEELDRLGTAWDDLVLSVSWGAAGAMSGSGFTYGEDDGSADLGELGESTVELLDALRAEADGPRGLCDGLVLRLHRGAAESELMYLYGAEADDWRVTPANADAVRDRGRPGGLARRVPDR